MCCRSRLGPLLVGLALLGLPGARALAGNTVGGIVQNAVTANGNGTVITTFGTFLVASYVVSGTFVATVNFEGSGQDGSFQALGCVPVTGGATVSSATAAGVWRCNIAGMIQIRGRVSGYTSGSVTVSLQATDTGTVQIGPPVDTGSPTQVVLNSYATSALPAAGTAGRLARIQDGGSAGALIVDDGSQWRCNTPSEQGIIIVSCPPYNASPTGTAAANTTAIQAAVNALPSGAAGGGIVFLPDLYPINGTIVVAAGNIVRFVGRATRQSGLDWQGGNNSAVIQFRSNTLALPTFDSVENLTIKNSGGATGVIGIQDSTTATLVNRNHTVITRVLIRDVATGFQLDANGAALLEFTHNYFFNVTTGILGSAGAAVQNLHILSNEFQGLSGWAVDIPDMSNGLFLNNFVHTGNATAVLGMRVDKFDGLDVTANEFEADVGSGTACGPYLLLGNTVLGTNSMSGAHVAANHFNCRAAAAGQIGIEVNFADGVVLDGNTFTNIDTGIQLTANAKKTLIGPQVWGTGVTTKASIHASATPPVIWDATLGYTVGGTGTNATLTVVGSGTPRAVNVGTALNLVTSTSSNESTQSAGALSALNTFNGTTTSTSAQFISSGALANSLLSIYGNANASVLQSRNSSTGATSSLVLQPAAAAGVQIGVPTGGDPGTGALNIATADGYLVNNTALKNITETLSNKTLSAPILSGSVTGTYTLAGTPTLGATLALNGQTLSGNATLTGSITNGTFVTPTINNGVSFTGVGNPATGPGIFAETGFLSSAGGTTGRRWYNNAVTLERMRLTDAGELQVGLPVAGGGLGTVNATNGYYINGSQIKLSLGTATIGTCGTSPTMITGSTDAYGGVNVGTGAVTACTVNFSKTLSAAPFCTMADNSTTVTGDVSSVTTSSVTFGFSASVGGGVLYYHCFGGV